MNESTQTILVLAIVLACAAYVAWQFVRTVRSANGKLGACCAKGCEAHAPSIQTDAPAPKREQFIASESLVRAVKARSR